jgi:hypothetical protein
MWLIFLSLKLLIGLYSVSAKGKRQAFLGFSLPKMNERLVCHFLAVFAADIGHALHTSDGIFVGYVYFPESLACRCDAT